MKKIFAGFFTLVMMFALALTVSADEPGSSFDTAIPLTVSEERAEAVYHPGTFESLDHEIYFTFTTNAAGTYSMFSQSMGPYGRVRDLVQFRLYDSNRELVSAAPDRPRLLADSVYYIVIQTGHSEPHGFENRNAFDVVVIDRTVPREGTIGGIHWQWWAVLGVFFLIRMRKPIFSLLGSIVGLFTAIGRPKIKPAHAYAPTKAKFLFLLGGGLLTAFGAVTLVNNLTVLSTLTPLDEIAQMSLVYVNYWDRIFRVMMIVLPALWIFSGLQHITYCLFGATRPWMYGLMTIGTLINLFSPYLIGGFIAKSMSVVPFTENLGSWFPFLADANGYSGLNLMLLWIFIAIGQMCYIALEWVERDADYYNEEEQISIPAFVFKILTRFVFIYYGVTIFMPLAADNIAMAPLVLAYGAYMFMTTPEWLVMNLTSIGSTINDGQIVNKKMFTILKWRLFVPPVMVWKGSLGLCSRPPLNADEGRERRGSHLGYDKRLSAA